MSNDIGLTNVLTGHASLEDAIQSLDVPNLDVICCGPLPSDPGEALDHPKFREIIEILSERYDRILFDSPPILPMSDAQTLGDMVDRVVLVVRVESTERSQVDQAFRLLEQIRVPLAGVVLNGVDEHHRYYRDYYPYYLNYLESERRERERREPEMSLH